MCLSSYGYIAANFLLSNRFGFPGAGRWLRRVKGVFCNAVERFSEGFTAFIETEYDRNCRGVACAAQLGKALGGKGGALCAAAGLLLPWLLMDAVADALLPGFEQTPFLLLLLLARAVVTSGALLGVMDLRLTRNCPIEVLLLLGGFADLFLDRVPATLLLLAAAAWQLLQSDVFFRQSTKETMSI